VTRKRIKFAQNFFKDQKLVALIVSKSSINLKDIVYEIGPGEGIITKELAKRAGRVVAIEKDSTLVTCLRNKFRDNKVVEIKKGDFLKYKIKEKEYKIFSNIPFNITAEVVKRILFKENPPKEAYLVVQKEAAQKFSGSPMETESSILAKPWFTIKILRKFQRTDFEPVPGVDVVFLYIVKRKQPLVSPVDAEDYRRFVKFGFEGWKKNLKTAYKNVFTYEQWKRLAKNLSFPIKVRPSELKFEQWLELFKYFQTNVIESKKKIILLG